MKTLRTLLTVVCLLATGFGADRHIVGGAILQTVRGVQWSTLFGAGTNFIFDSPSLQTNACLFIMNNNPTNARSVFIGVAISPDPLDITFTSRYVLPQFAGGQSFTITPLGAQSIPLQSNGGSHLTIGLTGGSGVAGGVPDTADIFIVNGSGCVRATNSAPSISNPTTVIPPTQWTIISHPASGTQATVTMAAVTGIRHSLSCFTWGVTASPAAVAVVTEFQILDGATVVWSQLASVPAAIGSTANNGLCGLNIVSTVSNSLTCRMLAGGVNILETVACSGYDQ